MSSPPLAPPAGRPGTPAAPRPLGLDSRTVQAAAVGFALASALFGLDGFQALSPEIREALLHELSALDLVETVGKGGVLGAFALSWYFRVHRRAP